MGGQRDRRSELGMSERQRRREGERVEEGTGEVTLPRSFTVDTAETV